MKMIRMLVPMILGVIVMTTMVQDASAHATGEHYAFLDVEEDALRVRLEIHETDLKSQFGLQLQTEIPSAEVVEQILAYALDRFEVRVADQKLNFRLTSADVFSPPQGSFLQLFLEAPWPGALRGPRS